MSNPGTNTPDFQVLANRFAASGQWERALETARDWLNAEPANELAHLVAGQSLVNLKRHAEAEPHVNRALACNPENDFAHRLASMIHFDARRFKAADEAIHRAISLDPEDAFHWYHLAWMSYEQGDRVSAAKFAEKARKLAPRDADIANLLALCAADHAATPAQTLRRYHEALELDPENSSIHNNIGVYHLNVTRDYAAAEECFRRALFFDPSCRIARPNLFLTIKHRDLLYRALCAPKDLLVGAASLASRARKQSILVYLLLLPLWIFMFRFVLGGLLLWCLFIWPLVKVYEYLTLGDLLSKAGEVGARRGGLLGYRRWPLKLRLGIFAASLLAFWGGVAWLWTFPEGKSLFGAVLGIGILVALITWLVKSMKGSRAQAHARRRSRRMADLLENRASKKHWWNFFSRRNPHP